MLIIIIVIVIVIELARRVPLQKKKKGREAGSFPYGREGENVQPRQGGAGCSTPRTSCS